MGESKKVICTCKRIKCERHGNCEQCLEYHHHSRRHPVPYCQNPKHQKNKENLKSSS